MGMNTNLGAKLYHMLFPQKNYFLSVKPENQRNWEKIAKEFKEECLKTAK